MVNVPRGPEPPIAQLDPLSDSFLQDRLALMDSEAAREGAGRFAEPRIRRRVEDVQQYQDTNPIGISTGPPPDEDGHIVADAIIQAAQDTASQGWEPTQWDRSILRMPEQQEEVPTLGGRVQQPVQSGVPGIAVDNSGRQHSTQQVPPPNTVQAIGSAAVLNVPLAATGFALSSFDAVANKFPELVDMLASGKYRTDDPEIVSRAVDIAGIVTSGSFSARVAQEGMRARSRARADTTAETGEPFTPPRDINLEVSDAGQGRFNIRAQVGDEQAVDAFVRNFRYSADDPGVLQFGRINVEEPWQRQGIATAIQEHLEATTGKPFIPDGFLTEEAYKRWLKIDPDAVKGHVRMADGDTAVYQRSMLADIEDQMRTGRPYTETPRMAEVRRAHAAGELQSPLGPGGEFTLRGQPLPQPEGLRGEFTLSTGGAGGDVPRVNFDIRRTVKHMGDREGTYRYHAELKVDGESIGYAVLHPVHEVNAFKFGNIEISDTAWRRRGLATALQQTLEARLGVPMVPDSLLTREAYARWRKLDPEAVEGRYNPPTHADDVYWERRGGQEGAYEETARMRQVREDAAAGRLKEPRIRREDYSLGMGAARDADTPAPRQLDPAGYYSHAHEVTQGLQPRGTPEQMWRGIERGGVRETEIRQLGLDELLLGKPIAEARRLVVDHVAELGRMRQEAKDLSTREGQDRWIARHYDALVDSGAYPNEHYQGARARQEQLNRLYIPEAERRLHAAQQNYDHQYTNRPQQPVTREDVARHIEENRPTINRETYTPPKTLNAAELKKAIDDLGGQGDWTPFNQALMNRTGGRMLPENIIKSLRDELTDHHGARLGATAHAIEEYYRLPRGSIGESIQEVTGRAITEFSPSRESRGVFIYAPVTLDPRNSTLRGYTLHLDTPSSPVVERLWGSLPPKDAATLRAAWRMSDEELKMNGHAEVVKLRAQHVPLLDRIKKETARGHFIDPHYGDLDIFGHYMSSLQRRTPEGEVTYVPHQIQSNWAPEMASPRGGGRGDSAPPGHPIVSNLQSWLDPTLRSIVRDAVEQGATSISLPRADTVFRYNPPGESGPGLTRLYNEAIPRRLQVIMKEFDSKYSSRGERVDRLHTYEGDPNVLYQDPGLHSGTIRRVNRTVEDVRHGFRGNWTTYPITPAIRRNFEQGRGMRLFSGGVPVDGEQDGQE